MPGKCEGRLYAKQIYVSSFSFLLRARLGSRHDLSGMVSAEQTIILLDLFLHVVHFVTQTLTLGSMRVVAYSRSNLSGLICNR